MTQAGMNLDRITEMAETDEDVLAVILFGSSARGEVYQISISVLSQTPKEM